MGKSAKVFGSNLKNHLRKCKRMWITEKLAEKNPKKKWQVVKTEGGTTRSSTKPYYTINGEHFNQKQTADMLNQFFTTNTPAISHTSAGQTIQNVWQFSVYRYLVFLINVYLVANTPKFEKRRNHANRNEQVY